MYVRLIVMSSNTTHSSTASRTTRLLTIVVALQALTLMGQWVGHEGPRMLPQAQAQLANPGADRQALIDELKTTNSKLDQLVGILQSGNLQVRVVNPDEQKSKDTGRTK